MSRATVRCETSKPSLSSSPWMRGAPQRGLPSAMVRTSSASSEPTGGRPDRLEIQTILGRRACGAFLHRRVCRTPRRRRLWWLPAQGSDGGSGVRKSEPLRRIARDDPADPPPIGAYFGASGARCRCSFTGGCGQDSPRGRYHGRQTNQPSPLHAEIKVHHPLLAKGCSRSCSCEFPPTGLLSYATAAAEGRLAPTPYGRQLRESA